MLEDAVVGLSIILVIDDDASATVLARHYLTKAGFNVVTANSGSKGLRLAQQLHPQAIILDVIMPEMDGWTVLSRLKADPDLAEIPVIMATMIDEPSLGYALGVSDYLIKPVNRDRLLSILNKYKPESSGLVMIIEDDLNTRAMMRRQLETDSWQITQSVKRADLRSFDLEEAKLPCPK